MLTAIQVQLFVLFTDHQSSERQLGSVDIIEWDCNTVVNQPASGKPRQSTTVPSQCEQLS